jgi:hypothetical protein
VRGIGANYPFDDRQWVGGKLQADGQVARRNRDDDLVKATVSDEHPVCPATVNIARCVTSLRSVWLTINSSYLSDSELLVPQRRSAAHWRGAIQVSRHVPNLGSRSKYSFDQPLIRSILPLIQRRERKRPNVFALSRGAMSTSGADGSSAMLGCDGYKPGT